MLLPLSITLICVAIVVLAYDLYTHKQDIIRKVEDGFTNVKKISLGIYDDVQGLVNRLEGRVKGLEEEVKYLKNHTHVNNSIAISEVTKIE